MHTHLSSAHEALIAQLCNGTCTDPHALLGAHPTDGGYIIRLWRPGAEKVWIELDGKSTQLDQVHPAGLFEITTDSSPNYRIYHDDGSLAPDPYNQPVSVEQEAIARFGAGVHYEIYNLLGAHPFQEGVRFVIWAPNAQGVCLVCDANGWQRRTNPMRKLQGGVWELFVPELKAGQIYKYALRDANGEWIEKIDPFAQLFEKRPSQGCVVYRSGHEWQDGEWMEKRGALSTIYEVHLGSWRSGLTYREVAPLLAEYCQEMHYSHVELLPPTEHPLDESWGYQVTGYFAPTSRYGTPDDFRFLVDHLHQAGIGVIIDWVPAHFPKDRYALARFDGTALYEHLDPRLGDHPHWDTHIFNYGRPEVANFLIGSALFWLKEMHVDGLRVDAVASLLYLDYGRQPGEWLPNKYGGRENIEALEFVKHLNATVKSLVPGVVMIAEESTSFPKATSPVEEGGLGFDYKWNLGWMNDTLDYFKIDPLFRKEHRQNLTFGPMYAFTENFINVLSHDEVVHCKSSLIGRMPGDRWRRFAQLRLLHGYTATQPGLKLLFMGGEFGMWEEWDCKQEIPWHLLNHQPHQQMQRWVARINRFVQEHPVLTSSEQPSFKWVDFHDRNRCIISYLRGDLLCVHHFTPEVYEDYLIPIEGVQSLREQINSDEEGIGGSGVLPKAKIEPHGIRLTIPPFATLIFSIGKVS